MITRNRKRTEQARNTPKHDPKRWRTYALMLICGLILVSGFFLAGRQHFSSMDYGMRNSRLRKQIDDLEAEKRRLLLTRAVSLSPAEIRKSAKKAGMVDQVQPESVVAQITSAVKDKALPAATYAIKAMIAKTASVSAVRPSDNGGYAKSDKAVRQTRKTMSTE